jgi:hypothetical protein
MNDESLVGKLKKAACEKEEVIRKFARNREKLFKTFLTSFFSMCFFNLKKKLYLFYFWNYCMLET